MGRSFIAVVLGCLVAGLVVAIIESIGYAVYPLPEGFDPKDMATVRAAMESMPAGAMRFVLFAWALGTLVGGGLAARIASRSPVTHALIVGALMMIAGIANMVTIPHPLWFWVVGVTLFLPSAYAGARLAMAITI